MQIPQNSSQQKYEIYTNSTNFISDLTDKEFTRQKNTLNLIASENYASPKTLKQFVWDLKYGEGTPFKRYYAGNENTDLLESFVQKKALEVFDTAKRFGNFGVENLENAESLSLQKLEINELEKMEKLENTNLEMESLEIKKDQKLTNSTTNSTTDLGRNSTQNDSKNPNQNIDSNPNKTINFNPEFLGNTEEYDVNVQVLSGSPANAMVFLAILEYGDTILSLKLSNGGHLSHLHSTSSWNKFFKLVNYDVVENGQNNFEIDENDFENKLAEFRPKLTILGASSYPRIINFDKLTQIAHKYGSLVLADVAHINGLIASGLHPSPFQNGQSGADFVTMTTHKTLRGPRAAMVFAKKEFSKKINQTIFPGTSGGPHFNKIAGIGQCCLEILGEDFYPDFIDFNSYSANILSTCKTLENSLLNGGLEIISPTQNHLLLVKLPDSSDSLSVQQNLEKIGIITNRNMIPFDPKSPWRPSGMRLGTAALTSRGLNGEMATELGQIICDCILERKSEMELKESVSNILEGLNWWY